MYAARPLPRITLITGETYEVSIQETDGPEAAVAQVWSRIMRGVPLHTRRVASIRTFGARTVMMPAEAHVVAVWCEEPA